MHPLVKLFTGHLYPGETVMKISSAHGLATSTHFVLSALIAGAALAGTTEAQHTNDKTFAVVVTDAHGMETEVKGVLFYWEEKVSETAFVPHELKQVPVKHGAATVHVRFDTIKQIEVKPGPDKGLPTLSIALTSGKTGEFLLAIPGSFKGESDFGQVEFPANGLKKVVFK
jgi:hypothetical protein